MKKKKEFLVNLFKSIKTLVKNHSRKLGALIIVIVFILLGVSLDWSCDTKKGFSCSGSYDPPDPEDVKRIIK